MRGAVYCSMWLPRPRAVVLAAPALLTLLLVGAGWPNGMRDIAPAREPHLCRETAEPDAPRTDPTTVNCGLETGGTASPGREESLVVAAYNLARGGRSHEQADILSSGVAMPRPDILLVSEADRGCARTGYRNVAKDLASRLGLSFAFAVEFVELPRTGGPGGRLDAPCEHGNAILSRYPLENVRAIRHAVTQSWHTPPGLGRVWGEPRLGGRVALAADVRIGPSRLRVYSLHLESGPLAGAFRAAQAAEVLADAEREPHPVLIGGDLNWHAYGTDLRFDAAFEPGAQAFRRRGYRDALAPLPLAERATHGPLVIDLLFGRGVRFEAAGTCPSTDCATLSDHLPVWARVRLPRPGSAAKGEDLLREVATREAHVR